jgi:hypothetical protein
LARCGRTTSAAMSSSDDRASQSSALTSSDAGCTSLRGEEATRTDSHAR